MAAACWRGLVLAGGADQMAVELHDLLLSPTNVALAVVACAALVWLCVKLDDAMENDVDARGRQKKD